jgi:septum formation topological specificity factor MinE
MTTVAASLLSALGIRRAPASGAVAAARLRAVLPADRAGARPLAALRADLLAAARKHGQVDQAGFDLKFDDGPGGLSVTLGFTLAQLR